MIAIYVGGFFDAKREVVIRFTMRKCPQHGRRFAMMDQIHVFAGMCRPLSARIMLECLMPARHKYDPGICIARRISGSADQRLFPDRPQRAG